MARFVLCAALVLSACGPAAQSPRPTVETRASIKEFRAVYSSEEGLDGMLAWLWEDHDLSAREERSQLAILPELHEVRAEILEAVRSEAIERDYPLLAELWPVMRAAEERHGLPPGIIAALAVWESSGGKNACGFNITGWGNCELRPFASYEEGIEVTAATLAGYGAQDTMGKLCTWRWGSPAPCAYGARGIATMEDWR